MEQLKGFSLLCMNVSHTSVQIYSSCCVSPLTDRISFIQKTFWTRGIPGKGLSTLQAWLSSLPPPQTSGPCVTPVSLGIDCGLCYCWHLQVVQCLLPVMSYCLNNQEYSSWLQLNFSSMLFWVCCNSVFLGVTILGKESSSFSVRVHVCPPPGFFKPSRFHPQRNNIRTDWYTGMQMPLSGKIVIRFSFIFLLTSNLQYTAIKPAVHY